MVAESQTLPDRGLGDDRRAYFEQRIFALSPLNLWLTAAVIYLALIGVYAAVSQRLRGERAKMRCSKYARRSSPRPRSGRVWLSATMRQVSPDARPLSRAAGPSYSKRSRQRGSSRGSLSTRRTTSDMRGATS